MSSSGDTMAMASMSSWVYQPTPVLRAEQGGAVEADPHRSALLPPPALPATRRRRSSCVVGPRRSSSASLTCRRWRRPACAGPAMPRGGRAAAPVAVRARPCRGWPAPPGRVAGGPPPPRPPQLSHDELAVAVEELGQVEGQPPAELAHRVPDLVGCPARLLPHRLLQRRLQLFQAGAQGDQLRLHGRQPAAPDRRRLLVVPGPAPGAAGPSPETSGAAPHPPGSRPSSAGRLAART